MLNFGLHLLRIFAVVSIMVQEKSFSKEEALILRWKLVWTC